MSKDLHKPVLLKQVIDVLSPKKGESYLDLTAGYGGHSGAIIEKIGNSGHAKLVDRDINAVDFLRQQFIKDQAVEVQQSDFLTASKTLVDQNKGFDMILADIGVSSPHIDNPDRGFSFMNDGPLDMRMDQSSDRSASDLVNNLSREDLGRLLREYGELSGSFKLADIIIQNRPYQTTNELASVIPGPHKKRIKTTAQVFQALRIEVNDELGQLSRSLPLWHRLLKPGGRLAVITFHSLEDRIVKKYFNEYSGTEYDSDLLPINKKAITADSDEVVYNPRARSAKLRAVQRK